MNTKLNQNPNWLELAKKANWSVRKLAVLCNVSGPNSGKAFYQDRGKIAEIVDGGSKTATGD